MAWSPVCPRVQFNSVPHLFSLIWWYIQNLIVSVKSAHVWIYFSVCHVRILGQLMWRILSQRWTISKVVYFSGLKYSHYFLISLFGYHWWKLFSCIYWHVVIHRGAHLSIFPHLTSHGGFTLKLRNFANWSDLSIKMCNKMEVYLLRSITKGIWVAPMSYIH